MINYLYDQGRRLTTKETKNINTNNLINKYKYGYNKVHMKTFEQHLHDSGKGNVMAYDELYRLTNMKFNVPDPTIENPTVFEKEKAIKYDHLHNILSIVENYNGQTKTITTDIPENSDYSKLNQYASFDQWGLDYDKKGNTTQKGTLQLSYDYRNQLVTAADSTSNTQVDMRYDVLGRRIQKAVTTGSQQKIENYYHSGHQVIEVRDGNDQVLRQYIYGNGIDEIIRMDKYENGTVTAYYYHTDANGSVTAITDANGQMVERVTYDIYGMPTFWDADGNEIPKSSIDNNILFHGREYDYELNLYYFRARYYDPIMGRFLQTDPMGYADSMNLYQGFNMNPVNFVDPMGELIYFTGEDPEKDFELFKNIFRKVGISNIDDILELKMDKNLMKYRVYIKGKKGLFGSLLKLNAKTSKGLTYWFNKKTAQLKNFPVYLNRTLTQLFEYLINKENKIIEFRTGKTVLVKGRKRSVKRYGGGVCLEPSETERGNIEVVVDPDNISSFLINKLPDWNNLYLDLPTTIVHEFGHAFASVLGYQGGDSRTPIDQYFNEMAVFFENLYRLMTKKSHWLRPSHDGTLTMYLNVDYYMEVIGGKEQKYE